MIVRDRKHATERLSALMKIFGADVCLVIDLMKYSFIWIFSICEIICSCQIQKL